MMRTQIKLNKNGASKGFDFRGGLGQDNNVCKKVRINYKK